MSNTTVPNDRGTRASGRKHISLLGLEPAPGVDDYADLPWYRREWVLFPLLVPLAVLAALTGDVFVEPNTRMQAHSDAAAWRFKAPAMVFIAAVGFLHLAVLVAVVL